MSSIRANGIEIAYEAFGAPAAAPLLLIMGFSAQMIGWEAEFCARLAGRGFRVIRFDNRDVGLSTKFDDACPDPGPRFAAAMRGEPFEPVYTLSDMAADAAGLLAALGIASAHVVGASMGGFIAQRMALEHAPRVRTLTSIMSSTGNPDLPPASAEALAALTQPRATSREEAITQGVETWRLLHGPGFRFDEERTRRLVADSFDRCFHPNGIARQMLAIRADGNRKPLLARVTAPTLVIHGSADRLVPFAAGRDTAEAIPGARLVAIEGMGHELPEGAWPQIIEAIAAHAR